MSWSYMRYLPYWLPVMVWMALIFVMSTSRFSMGRTAKFIEPFLRLLFPRIKEQGLVRAHVRLRETAHFGEYLILGLLLFRAIRGDSERAWELSWMIVSVLITIGYAVADELHQRWEEGRTPKLRHVMIDIAGGLAAQVLIFLCVGALK